ncbi:HipA family kinase [Brevibacillus daliensis]|uniref:HipA family kinase n=1 Tax=Brevibacillus daliensis TaxID=2892995 RepID=UPI001E3E4563|nr:HipA family kinase [Brevibacillus daliensis]
MSSLVYHKQLEGKSEAHLVTLEDGDYYVIKTNKPGFEKTVANEWVGYCFARFLELPVPPSRIISLPESFYLQNENLHTHPYMPYQFASRYIPHTRNLMNTPFPPTLLNSESIPRLIMFDYWMYNMDRTKKNILLQEHMESPSYWIIDQAEILGSPNWTSATLGRLPIKIMKSSTHEMLASLVPNQKAFLEATELISTIPSLLIEEVVSMIPACWLPSNEERSSLISTLVKRKERHLSELCRLFIKKVYMKL